jgi:hypothetical protein
MRNEPVKNAYALDGANGNLKYSSKKENYQREIKYIFFVNFQTIS